MAVVTRVRRLVNPRTKSSGRRKAKSKSKHRRRLTPAQIKAGFGGKRRLSAYKAARKRKTAPPNPKHKTASRPRVRGVTTNPGRTRVGTKNAKARRTHAQRQQK